jgi:hypothetical protein
LLHTSPSSAMRDIIFSASRCTSRTPSSAASVAGAPPPLAAVVPCHRLSWPRLLGPPRDEPWTPTGARRPPLAPHTLPRRRRPFSGRHRPFSPASSVLTRVRDVTLKFD